MAGLNADILKGEAGQVFYRTHRYKGNKSKFPLLFVLIINFKITKFALRLLFSQTPLKFKKIGNCVSIDNQN